MGKVSSGVSGAAPIWRRIMLATLPSRNKEDFSIPDKIVNASVDKVSGFASHDGFPSKNEYFIEGTQLSGSDSIHMKLKVCKDKLGLATPEDVTNGNYNEKEFWNFKEEDPISTDGRNRWQEGIDGWINLQANKEMYFAPTNYCRTDGLVGVNFDQPGDRSTTGNTVSVKISTSSIKKITEAKLWVDGNEVKSWSERPFETELNMTNGPHTLKTRVVDKDGASAEKEIKIGVNVAWDWSPSPTPTITPIPTVILPSTTPIVSIAPTIVSPVPTH